MDKIQVLCQTVKEIREENEALGDLLILNVNSAFESYKALCSGGQVDVSDRLAVVSEILGIDIEDLVLSVLEANSKAQDENPLTKYINGGEMPEISEDEYQKFLEEIKHGWNLRNLQRWKCFGLLCQ